MSRHDDERALARALGGPLEEPRRTDDAFVHAVLGAVEERRARPSPWAVSAWAGAGAAAALALFVSLTTAPPAEMPLDEPASLALLDEEELGYPAALDEEPLEDLDELEDEELLALMAALDEALSL